MVNSLMGNQDVTLNTYARDNYAGLNTDLAL